MVGVVLAVADTRGMPWAASAIAEAFWSQPEMPASVVPYHRFLHGVLGAVIAGWGMTMVVVAGSGRRAWQGLLAGGAVWFVLDTVASVWHGALANVALNCLALAGGLVVWWLGRTADDVAPPAPQ